VLVLAEHDEHVVKAQLRHGGGKVVGRDW
jgi:hypothetical protein